MAVEKINPPAISNEHGVTEKKIPLVNVRGLKRSTTGTENYSGYFREDYKTRFDNKLWPVMADRMVRSDEKILEIYNEVRNPILSALYAIEPASQKDSDIYIKEYIKEALVNAIDFQEFIENSLVRYKYGFSAFEIVHKFHNHKKFGNMVSVEELSYISPKTVERFDFDRELKKFKGIYQIAHGDLSNMAFVPKEQLLLFTMNKEGDNWQGMSPLRSCYRYWLVKNELIDLQRKGIAYSATGIPVIILNTTKDEDMDAAYEAIDKFIAGENQGMVIPSGGAKETQTQLVEMKTNHDSEKITKFIEYLDRGIAKVFNAAFTELGNNGVGSHAQSQNRVELFLSGLELEANKTVNEINRKIIEPLVIWKYGEQEKYPYLKVSGINDLDLEARSKQLERLKKVGLIQPSDSVIEQTHNEFGLPDYDPDADIDSIDNVEKDKKVIEDKEENGEKRKEEELHDCSGEVLLSENAHPASKLIDKRQKVLEKMMREELSDRTNRFIDTIIKKLKKKDARRDIFATTIPSRGAYSRELYNELGVTAVLAKEQALKELKLGEVKLDELTDKIKTLPADIKTQLKTEVDLISQAQDNRLKQDLLLTLNRNLGETDSLMDIRMALQTSATAYLNSQALSVGATNFSSTVVNSVRNDVFQTKEAMDKIALFQFSNPSPVSAICTNLNGKIFTKEEYNTTSYLPPLHHRCKSVIVPLSEAQARNKEVTTGLVPTGSVEQVTRARNSIKF